MSENFIEWEEDYKRKRLHLLREAVVKDVRAEFEAKIEELLEQERVKMEE